MDGVDDGIRNVDEHSARGPTSFLLHKYFKDRNNDKREKEVRVFPVQNQLKPKSQTMLWLGTLINLVHYINNIICAVDKPISALCTRMSGMLCDARIISASSLNC